VELLKFIDPKDLQRGPIHWAAGAGQTEIVESLLQTGHVDPNLRDSEGNTPLCLAARRKSPSTLKTLLRAGADVEEHSDSVDRYYGLSNSVRRVGDINRGTALHAWACNGRGWGSEAGCDINAKDSVGKTPLFHWSKFHASEWVSAFLKLLLEYGADASATDNMGNTPLHLVTGQHTDSQIRSLINAGGDMNARRRFDDQMPLMCLFGEWGRQVPADWHEHVQKYGIDPNAHDLDGRSVLHRVLALGVWNVPEVTHWLQAGADPNIKDSQGQNRVFTLGTSPPYNLEQAEEALVRVLQTAGIDVIAKNHRGRHFASNAISRKKNLENLKRLRSYGFDLIARDYEGQTALHILARPGCSHHSTSDYDYRTRFEYRRFLIDNGIDANARDYAGNTMLHGAIQNAGPYFNSARLLLDTALNVGADPSLRNHKAESS